MVLCAGASVVGAGALVRPVVTRGRLVVFPLIRASLVAAARIPALADLRSQGVIGAIGAGMNQSAMLARFVREGDMDVLLLAGRYTILDHEGLDDLLPLCQERGVGIVIGAPATI